MSSSPQLAPPGSSTYSSDTLHVGDGTWDSQRNSFLLPNLMGLNFETMQYNGMGNRFRDMAGYHPLIKAHGVIAAIVFLGLVPGAILTARFYSPSAYMARRLHMWMQSLTVMLSTVVFVLGWFAVGPRRSLTNPHHGIGLAIYVLIMVQMCWGWFVHKRSHKGRRPHIPLKLMLHHWLGRAIALLGIAQIPLGLALYGSPKYLFVLFTLTAFALLFIYFVLTYLHERRVGADFDSRGSYSSGPEVVDDGGGGHGKLGRVAAAGAAAAGAGYFANRFRRRSRSRSPAGDYSEATSYITEKDQGGGWGKKLMGAGALLGGAALAKKFFSGRRDRERDNESGRYHPAHTVTDSVDDSISRVEEGRPPPHPGQRRRYDGPPSPEQSGYTESEFTRPDERRDGHGIRNALLGAGGLFGVKQLFKNRQDKKDERRREEIRRAEMEAERRVRERGRRYTGDGDPPRRGGRRHSPISDITGPTDPEAVHTRPANTRYDDDEVSGTDTGEPIGRRQRPSTAATGAAVGGAVAGPSSGHRRRSGGREDSVDSQPVSIRVRMHDQGRRVTLRQLTEEEASANRDTRRRERHRRSGRRRRDGSLSGTETDDHWRRVEEQERRQEEAIQRDDSNAEPTPVPSAAGPPSPSGPAPPFPHSGTGHGPSPPFPQTGHGENVSSPTGFSPLPPPPAPGGPGGVHSPISTELSGSYASRSGRRRAERRTQGRSGRQHSVEFT